MDRVKMNLPWAEYAGLPIDLADLLLPDGYSHFTRLLFTRDLIHCNFYGPHSTI
jgi:hypothetical protein